MGEICIPTGDVCYNCEDYAGAFACLKKIKISGMSVLSELELKAALGNECGDIRVAASVMPCEGGAYTTAVSLKDLFIDSGGAPLGIDTRWAPFDLGDVQGCWYKFNKDLVITRAEFPDFFTAVGIAGDTYTIKGMEGKLAMGSGASYCNNSEILGNSGSEVTLGCENLPGCPIQITDPGHPHGFTLPMDRDGQSNPEEVWSFEMDSGKGGFRDATFNTNPAFTGITATHQVGQGGSGNPVALNVQPWSQCGSWYIRLSNDCN